MTPREAEAVGRRRRVILAIAVDEMSHLPAAWNITSALGGVSSFHMLHRMRIEPNLLTAPRGRMPGKTDSQRDAAIVGAARPVPMPRVPR